MSCRNFGWFACVAVLVLGGGKLSAVVPGGAIPELDPARPRLRPTGPVPAAEQAAFQRFSDVFSQRTERDDFSAPEEFLRQFPRGAWAPALKSRLAEEYYATGWYSKAIRALEEVWDERGDNATATGRYLSTHVGVQLAELYARLGRREDLERVVAVLEQGAVATEDLETLRGVQQGLGTMTSKPEGSFRCGALALERIRVFLNTTNTGHAALLKSRSSAGGMNLAEVAALSRAVGMNYQMAFRPPGAPLVTPAVMHLRIGHFVSLLRQVKGKVQLEDPTGWQTTFITPRVVEAEASGYFLLPPGPLPKGWRRVEATEAAGVFGRNGAEENDPDATTKHDEKSDCGGGSHGLATWDLHLMLVSQEMVDTPIRYEPPFGPALEVTFRHIQRANQRFGFKPEWTHNWTGQVYENPRALLGDLWIQEEGGWQRFSALDDEAAAYQEKTFNTGRLERPDSKTLVWTMPDGSKNTYSTFSDPEVLWGRVFFLSAVTDPAGNRITIQTSPNGRVESVTDASGRVTRFYYELTDPGIPPNHGANVLPNGDYTNQVTKIVDPFGRTAVLQYAKVERSIGTDCGDPEESSTCLIYYYNYDLVSITDPAGLQSQFAYDATGTLVTDLGTPYGTTHFRWFDEGRAKMDITDPEGNTERYQFSGDESWAEAALWNRPQGMRTEGAGYQVAHWGKEAYAKSLREDSTDGATLYLFQSSDTWASAGRGLMAVKRPLENAIWYNYPGQGSAALPGIGNKPNRTGRVLDDGSTQLWQSDRDAWGNVVRTVDPLGRTTRYIYAENFIDLLEVRQVLGGREELLQRATWNDQHLPLTILDAAGQTTRYTYNARGQLTSVTNPRQETTTFTYDDSGFLSAIDGPLAGAQDRSTLSHDAVGRIATLTDPDGYTLSFEYDSLDRLTRVSFPDGTSETRTYDRKEVGTFGDRLGRQTKLAYDGLGRVTSIQDALGRLTRIQWCGCGGLSGIIDALGRRTQWHRDLEGRVIVRENADGTQISYEYEQTTSRLKRRRDERQQITELAYNGADELVSRRYLNAVRSTPDVFYNYDLNYPRVVSMTDGEGLTTYSYYPVNGRPGAGQLASVDGPWANDEITFDYDELGRQIKRAVSDFVAEWAYDPAGRLTRLTNGLGVFDHTWVGGSGRLQAVVYPNGQRSDFAYYGNEHDELLQRITHLAATGARLSEFTYSYDPARRITRWTQFQTGRLKTWVPAYDAADRLTSIEESFGPNASTRRTWTYDAADNLTAEEANGERREFTYNALNQIAGFKGLTPFTAVGYEWDAENRLVAITNANRRVEFGYDGLGRRTRVVEREGASVVSDRRYLWCGQQLCEERDASGGVVLKRYSRYGQRNLAAPELPVGDYFFTHDHLGSVREMASGATTAFDYAAYGEQQTLAGAGPAEFGYTGHFQNRSTGTLLALHRAYSPGLARWLSRDPIGEGGGLNLYAYVKANPFNLVDPLGLDDAPAPAAPSGLSGFVDRMVERFGPKSVKVGPVDVSLEKPEVSAGTSADVEVNGQKVVSVEAEGGVGVTTTGGACDELFYVRWKIGFKSILSKIPGIGKHFEGEKSGEVKFGKTDFNPQAVRDRQMRANGLDP